MTRKQDSNVSPEGQTPGTKGLGFPQIARAGGLPVPNDSIYDVVCTLTFDRCQLLHLTAVLLRTKNFSTRGQRYK